MLVPILLTLAAAACGAAPEAARTPVDISKLPPHPRLLVNEAELAAIRLRKGRADWAAKAYAALKADADGWLKREVRLPDRGSQWYHYYSCPKHGARLRTESPTRHVCPIDGEVFTGYPYDDVVLSNEHSALARGARNCGLLYALEGEERYARRASEILLAYADRYRGYPLHDIRGEPRVGGGRVGPQTLDEAVWLIPMAQAADLVWTALSEADRRKLEEGLFRPAVEVIEQHKMGIHNIQCWKNSAVGLVGLLLGDAGMLDRALNAPSGFHNQVAQGITEDGPWFEGAWGYHFYTLSALVHLTEAAYHSGIDLYGPRLKRMFDAPLDLAMPNLMLPAFHDSGEVSLPGQAGHFEVAYARYKDPRYLRVLSQTTRQSDSALLCGVVDPPGPPREAQASRDFGAAGFAVLRAGAGRDATYLALDYGPHGGGHGHPDKLSFVLYSRGGVLAPDPGTANYGVPIQAGWYRTSVAHNTLTVDEASQAAAEGRREAFAALPGFSAFSGWAGEIYQGVSFRRAVALLGDDLLLVADRVRSEEPRTLDLAYYNRGVFTDRPAGEPWTPPEKPGYSYLRDTRALRTDGAWSAGWERDGVRVSLTMAGALGTEVVTGTGVGSNTEDRVPLVLARRRSADTRYLWALRLGSAEAPGVEEVPVRAVEGESEGAPPPESQVSDAAALRCRAGSTEVLLLVSDGEGLREAGGLRSDGRIACLKRGGGAGSLILVEGTRLSADGISLRAEAPATLSVETSAGRAVSVTCGERPAVVTLTLEAGQSRLELKPGETRRLPPTPDR